MQLQIDKTSKKFSDRLKALRGDRSQAEFCRTLGIKSQATYARYEAGRVPSGDVLLQMASHLGVSVDELLTGEPSKYIVQAAKPLNDLEITHLYSAAPAGRLVKVASWAQAGDVTVYEDIAPDWQLEISTDCRDADAVGVQLRGDSMLPIYQEGDIVVMMPSREPRTGCLVVAKLREEGVCFKLYTEPTRGVIRLSSYNEAYPPFERRRDDFEWICPVFETRRNVWR